MKKFNVTIQERFVSPLFWNDFKGKQYILEADDRIINNKLLIIENDPKNKLIVFGSWNPYAYEYDKYISHKKQVEIDRKKAITERKLFYKNQEKEAIQFNESLKIPVVWTSEIKQVLSGLNDGSNGDGCKINTVHHIYLHEELLNGRLKRPKNEFLCSPVKSKHHGNWSGTLGTNGLEVKVDCKACLKIAERFKQQ